MHLCDLFSHPFPEPFDGIEVRTVSWEIDKIEVECFGLCLDDLSPMPGSAIQDDDNPLLGFTQPFSNTFQKDNRVFFVAAAIGGISGVLVSLDKNIYPTVGLMLGFKGFTASVIGGIGSIPGALLGGLVLGILENFSAGYISSGYNDAIAFLLLAIFLLVRPKGLLGVSLREV